MTSSWEQTFQRRMDGFELSEPPPPNAVAVSIKVRVVSGCYHREHSPHAYEIIDHHLHSIPANERAFAFEEHESGPEVLLYLAITTAGITLATSIINLITTIIKARSKGVEQGDHPCSPIELILRRIDKRGQLREEKILRIGHSDHIDPSEIERKLSERANEIIVDEKDSDC